MSLFDDTFTALVALFGIFAVGAFSFRRFDSPSYTHQQIRKRARELRRPGAEQGSQEVPPVFPRHLTSRGHYWFWLFFYVCMMEIVYLAIALNLDKLLPHLGLPAPPTSTGPAFNVLVAALIMTSLLPNTPGVNRLEDELRKALHQFARIPSQARAEILRLEKARFDAQPDRIEDWVSHAAEPEDLALPPLEIKHRWAKAVYLIESLRIWSLEAPVGSFLSSASSGWDFVGERKKFLQKMIKIHRAGLEGRGPEFDDELSADIDGFLERLYTLAGCSLAAYGGASAQRSVRRAWLGFRSAHEILLSPHTIVFVLFSVSCCVLFTSGVMAVSAQMTGLAVFIKGTMIEMDSWDKVLLWSASAALMHGGTVVLVLLLKRHFNSTGRWKITSQTVRFAERPFMAYFLVSVAGMLWVLLVLLCFSLTLGADFQWWWAVIGMATAGALAYHIDTFPSDASMWGEAASQALFVSAVAYVATVTGLDVDQFFPRDTGPQVLVLFITAQAFVISCFLGAWVPDRYRKLVYPASRDRELIPAATPQEA